MHLPPGFETDTDEVLKLKKNLYGLKQGGYNFWVKLRDFLLAQDFHQSEHDHCVFIKNSIIVLSYVDDYRVFAQKGKSIKNLIKAFNDAKFEFMEEGSVSSYLGVKINRNRSNIELTQPFLTDRVIREANLVDANSKDIPAVKPLLQKAT